MKNKNFSIVSYLSGEEYKKVRELQRELSEITDSRKSLEDWQPHITLGDAIIVPEDRLGALKNELSEFCKLQNNVNVVASGFGGIDNWVGEVKNKITPYVIWLDVKSNSDLDEIFLDLRKKITSRYNAWIPRSDKFSPHITLAFADLSEDGYKKGREHLLSQSLELDFSISNLSLVECFGEGSLKSLEIARFNFRDSN